MAKEGAEKLTINNSSSYFQVIADKDYDEALEASLQAIVDGSDVYKRQSGRRGFVVAATTMGTHGTGQAPSCNCLLYTSRCV